MSESAAASRAQVDEDAPIAPVPAWLRTLLAPFWTAMIVIGVAWFLADDRGFWFLAGAACCFVVSLPLMQRGYDLLSPWTVILVAVYISTGVRGLFISLGAEGSRSIDDLFLMGRDEPYYFRPAVLFVLALIMLVVGYLVAGKRRRSPSVRPGGANAGFSSPRVTLAVLVCAGVGFAALLQFMASTGGFSLASLSAKRTTITGLDLTSEYQSSGQWRILNQFAPIALWVQLAHYAKQGRRLGAFTHRGIWIGLLFLNAIALPVYASSRADVVYIVLGALVVQLALRPGSVSLRPLLVSGAVVLVLVSALTTARSSANDPDGGAAVNQQALIDAFVLSRTFTDIPATGNIINAVPEPLPYAKGETIAAWAVAPIPRSLWPDKPIVSSGPTIGILIYGNQRSGVPPGMIAESYWNFGVGGIVVLPLLCGVFLRLIGERWRGRSKTDPGAAVLMAGVAMPNGVYLMTNSIGSAPFQAFVALVLLLPVVAFVRERRVPQSHALRERGRRVGTTPTRLTGASAQEPSLPR